MDNSVQTAVVNAENYRDHYATHNKGNSWWLNDVKGIPLCRVCDDCHHYVTTEKYAPHVTGIHADAKKYEEEAEACGESVEEDY